jgi:tetratricopeptide (TPR) repeat protein
MKFARKIAWLVVLVSGVAVAQNRDWQQNYVVALTQFEKGNFEAAALALEESISRNPQPETGGIDYLPYIYLAVSRFELGQNNAARDALVMSHVKAKASTTESGQILIESYGAQIMNAPLTAPVTASIIAAPINEKPLPVADPKPLEQDFQVVSLSENEVDTIRQQVLKDCEFCTDVSENKMPWYFHYKMGVDLMAAGDVERALESFKIGVSLRTQSSRDSRTYGMWYIDYLPYYQIAMAYAKLGNWKNAQTAISVSDRLGEFSPRDRDYEEFTELQVLIANHAQDNES